MRECTYDVKRFTHVFMNGVRTITLTLYYDHATERNVNFLLAATVLGVRGSTKAKRTCTYVTKAPITLGLYESQL